MGSPDDTVPMEGMPTGRLRTFVTDDPDRFVALAARFLEMEIERPTLVKPNEEPDSSAPPILRAAG